MASSLRQESRYAFSSHIIRTAESLVGTRRPYRHGNLSIQRHAKRSLNLANHKRIPHDPRTIDCGVPIRDSYTWKPQASTAEACKSPTHVRNSLWKHQIKFDIQCSHRGRVGHHFNPERLYPPPCREGIVGSWAMRLSVASNAGRWRLDLNQKHHRSRTCVNDLTSLFAPERSGCKRGRGSRLGRNL